MMDNDLTRKDKRQIKELIPKGVEKEYGIDLERCEQILAEWRTTAGHNREYYHKLRDEINGFYKYIVQRYDYTRDSMQADILSVQVFEKLIDESELDAFRPEVKALIAQRVEIIRSYRLANEVENRKK